MTKKTVRSADRQLIKLAQKKEQALDECCTKEFVLESLAVLADLASRYGEAIPPEMEKKIQAIKERERKMARVQDRNDTLEAAIRSGKFASIDEGW